MKWFLLVFFILAMLMAPSYANHAEERHVRAILSMPVR